MIRPTSVYIPLCRCFITFAWIIVAEFIILLKKVYDSYVEEDRVFFRYRPGRYCYCRAFLADERSWKYTLATSMRSDFALFYISLDK